MIKKILSLFFCMITLSGVICGCDRTPNKRDEYKSLDTDKAAEAALEYMNNKYDREFQVVSSEKDANYSFVPGVVQDYWCDVELVLTNQNLDEPYIVRVTLNENTEKYIVQWDTYMTELVKPWLKDHMDTITNNIFYGDFFSICNKISDVNCDKGFASDFTFASDDRLSDMLYKNDVFGYYIIVIPEKRFKDNSTMDLIYEQFNKEISDSSIKVEVRVYEDVFYDEYEKSFRNGNGIPNGYEQYKVKNETISFKK